MLQVSTSENYAHAVGTKYCILLNLKHILVILLANRHQQSLFPR